MKLLLTFIFMLLSVVMYANETVPTGLEQRKLIVESVKKTVSDELGSECIDEQALILGEATHVATGGVNALGYSFTSIYKTKCNDVLIKVKMSKNNKKVKKITIDFDSKYTLRQFKEKI